MDLTDIMMVTVAMTMMMTIFKLNQTSGTFTDQPNSRGAFLSSDCLDKPKQVLVNLEILKLNFYFHFHNYFGFSSSLSLHF